MLTKLWRATLLDWTICDYCDLIINYLILADTCGGRGFVLCQNNDYAQPDYFSWSSPATSKRCAFMSARSGKKWPSSQTPTGVSRDIRQERSVLNYIIMLWFAQSVGAAFFKVTLLLIDARCVKPPKCHYRLTKKCFKLRFRLGFEKYTFDFCFGSGTEVPSLPPRSSELKPNLNWEKIIFASISSKCLVRVWQIGASWK